VPDDGDVADLPGLDLCHVLAFLLVGVQRKS
jgi:hypothetical protein